MALTPSGVEYGQGPSWYDVFTVLEVLHKGIGKHPYVRIAPSRSVDGKWLLSIRVVDPRRPQLAVGNNIYQPGYTRSPRTVAASIYVAAMHLHHWLVENDAEYEGRVAQIEFPSEGTR